MCADLVSIVEVAEMLGVSRQRVHQILRAYPDFPAPEAELAVGRIWRRQPLPIGWSATPRSTGRPRKSDISPAIATPAGIPDNNGPPVGGAVVSRGGRKTSSRPRTTTHAVPNSDRRTPTRMAPECGDRCFRTWQQIGLRQARGPAPRHPPATTPPLRSGAVLKENRTSLAAMGRQ